MKVLRALAAFALGGAIAWATPASSPAAPAQPSPVDGAGARLAATNAAFEAIAQRIRLKMVAANGAKPDLAPELKQLADLAAQVKGADPELAAKLLAARAMLYLELLGQPEEAIKAIQQIQQELPDTEVAREAPKMFAAIVKLATIQHMQAALAVGRMFPPFEVRDLAGQPLSIAQYTGPGKVVLIDFWATWCVPCLVELPNVLAVYNKYHDKGFNIIGVSLDENRPKLEAFLKQQGMTWPQYNDGKRWDNALAVKYGIGGIPATFLLDGEGRIIGKDLRGPELERAVAAALEKK